MGCVTTAFKNLTEVIERLSKDQLPPVHLWQPAQSGEIDICIKRNGEWWHEGTRIERHRLVVLFASILRREGDDYYLITPVEKWKILVDDVPFIATSLEILHENQQQHLVFTSNVGDIVIADQQHPLTIVENAQQLSPYLDIRDGLRALLSRPVYYQLADLCVENNGSYGVYSAGNYFPLSTI